MCLKECLRLQEGAPVFDCVTACRVKKHADTGRLDKRSVRHNADGGGREGAAERVLSTWQQRAPGLQGVRHANATVRWHQACAKGEGYGLKEEIGAGRRQCAGKGYRHWAIFGATHSDWGGCASVGRGTRVPACISPRFITLNSQES